MTPSGQEWRFKKSCPVAVTITHREWFTAKAMAVRMCAAVSGQTTNDGCHASNGLLRVDWRHIGETNGL